jgi:NADPH:quinone reductase-like Zn-dependent oxidoreductase
MKAFVHQKYGQPDVLEIRQIEKPTHSDDEVLVKVRATTVNPAEWYAMVGILVARAGSGWLRPKDPRIGVDFAGVVEGVGKNVTDFKPGDEVYGGRTGAYAEYICVRKSIARKPRNVSFEQAASVPTAGITALQGLRDQGKLQAGQSVLITGAAGGVGHFAVQMAKAMGAEVTAVGRTQSQDFLRSLGADHVVDYTKEDYTQSGRQYDLIFDLASTKSWSALRRVLKPNGVHVMGGAPGAKKAMGPVGQLVRLMSASMLTKHKTKFFVAQFNRPDLATMCEMIESGSVVPRIEETYTFEQLPQAMAKLGDGHVLGKLAVTVASK